MRRPVAGSSSRDLLASALSGKLGALARLMSRIENRSEDTTGVLEEIYALGGNAHIVGITGVPGSGKSSLVAKLAGRFRAAGRKVGVVAVDPTSPFTGGSILGDRIRMSELGSCPKVAVE